MQRFAAAACSENLAAAAAGERMLWSAANPFRDTRRGVLTPVGGTRFKGGEREERMPPA
jgi:hypothetical protein